MSDRLSVSSADFVRNVGYWLNEALHRPISITHHGRERLVLALPREFNPRATTDTTGKASLEELRAEATSKTPATNNGNDGRL